MASISNLLSVPSPVLESLELEDPYIDDLEVSLLKNSSSLVETKSLSIEERVQIGSFFITEYCLSSLVSFEAEIQILETWEKIAQQKYIDSNKRRIFKDSRNLCIDIRRHLLNFKNFSSENTLFISRDKNDKIQAIAFFKKRSGWLNFLITHPDNILDPINQDNPNCVRGAATSLILHIASFALKKLPEVTLVSTTGAIEFYKRLGFKKNHSEEDEYTKMTLTSQKIEKSILQKKFPFNLLIQSESNEGHEESE